MAAGRSDSSAGNERVGVGVHKRSISRATRRCPQGRAHRAPFLAPLRRRRHDGQLHLEGMAIVSIALVTLCGQRKYSNRKYSRSKHGRRAVAPGRFAPLPHPRAPSRRRRCLVGVRVRVRARVRVGVGVRVRVRVGVGVGVVRGRVRGKG